MSSTAQERARVVIVGGGPAGLATAIELRRRGCEVVVLERSRYDDLRLGEHLAPEAVAAAQRLGAGELVEPPRARLTPGTRSAWGSPELLARSDMLSPWGHGRTVARPSFDAALAELARARGVELRLGQGLRRAQRQGEAWRLELDAGEELRARVLVDATGRRASVARQLGARVRRRDELVGVGRRCEPLDDGPRETSLMIDAHAEGWCYSAPLPDGALMLICFFDAGQLAGREPAAAWEAALALTRHTLARRRDYGPAGAAMVRSARSQRLEPAAGPGWLAVGDAALARDPLSGAGLSAALRGAEAAAELVCGLAHDTAGPEHAARHDAALAAEFARYLDERAAHYALETRFVGAAFWARARASSPMVDS